MRELAAQILRWVEDGERVALATVVSVEGSSPRPAGARMAVTASGGVAGSISNGCVEGAVYNEIQETLAADQPRHVQYGIPDERAWEVGLSCGGSIDVYVECLAKVHVDLLHALACGETVALATHLGSGHHLALWPDGRRVGVEEALAPWIDALNGLFPGPGAELRSSATSDWRECVFLEVFVPPPVLVIVGAVHIAVPLVSLAQALGFRVCVIDPRRVFATCERFPTADELTVAWPQKALQSEEFGPRHALAILSHDPKFDLPTLRIALRSEAGYIGLIGSRSTQADRRAALREDGFTDEELERIHGPIGLDLGGREPQEIALAVLAEIVAVRHGTTGGMLSAKHA